MIRSIIFASVLWVGSLSGANAKGEGVVSVPFPSILEEVESSEIVEIAGILKVSDELIIYDSQVAQDLELIYPYCISATGNEFLFEQAQELEGKRVKVHGRRHAFEDLDRAQEGEFLEAGRKLNGQPVSNWCWGTYIIEIDSIKADD